MSLWRKEENAFLQLTEQEKTCFMRALAFASNLDGLLVNSLSEVIKPHITSPETVLAIPEVTLGYDTKDWENGAVGTPDEGKSWMFGLTWKDTFQADDKIGFAMTQPLKVTDVVGGGATGEVEDPYIWEAYYSWKVNDSMSLTPAIFGGQNTYQDDDDLFGGVLTTTFKF